MVSKDKINQDLKTALLSGDKVRAEVVKSLKSAILYEEVAKKVREAGLDEKDLVAVVARESKKRAESAKMYQDAGETGRAQTELAEKAIIDEYLPPQMSDEELSKLIDEVISQMGDNASMGPVIGMVKTKAGASVDGARVAVLVKEKLGV